MCDIIRALWYLKQVSPFAEGNGSIGSIATSVTGNEFEKMERKDVCKKVKTLPMKTSVKPSFKAEATFVSDLSFQRGFLANGCNISFDNWKGHELWIYLPVLFESTI